MERSIGITGCLVVMLIAGLQMLGTPSPGGGSPAGTAGPKEKPAAPWAFPLQEMDVALAEGEARAAQRAWHQAFLAVLGSGRWEGMLEVGDARLKMGQTVGAGEDPRATARKLYLDALLWARGERSLDGVLRAGEAFAALGDREVVEQALSIAQGMATGSRDPQAQERLRAFRERWTTHPLQAEGQGIGRP